LSSGQLVIYDSLIGFHPRWLKASTGDELPCNGLRSCSRY